MDKNSDKQLSTVNYPRIDLQYALEKINFLARQIDDQVLPETEIAKKLDYKGLTARAIAVVAALKKYGLLEKQAGKFKVSQLAKKIFDPNNSNEMRASIQEAAFSPGIFARLYERFEKRLPSTEELDEFLESQNIIEPTRKRIIKSYQKTFEFAVGQHDDFFLYPVAGGASSSAAFEKETNKGASPVASAGQQNLEQTFETVTGATDEYTRGGGQTLIFPLVGNVEAKISFNRTIEGRHIESLIQYLQLHKSQNFPEKG